MIPFPAKCGKGCFVALGNDAFAKLGVGDVESSGG